MGFSGGLLTYPFTKIAANGQGDLQRALGSSVMSHFQLVGDVDANGNRAYRTKPMAKFKPFRSSTAVFPSNNDRESARALSYYGMGSPRQVIAAQILDGSGLYSYEPPRGDTVSPAEPLRALDFDGYAPKSISPFRMLLGTAADGSIVKSDTMHIWMCLNASAAQIYAYEGQDGTWQGDGNMAIADFLRTYYTSSYYLAFIIVDVDGAGHDTNLVIYNRDIVTACRNGINTIDLFPSGDGSRRPAIPIIRDAALNRHFKIVACWTTWPSDVNINNYDYYVYEGPSYGNMLWSFQFLPDIDRYPFWIGTTPPDITGSLTAFTMQDLGIVPYFSVYTMHQFRITSLTASVKAATTGSYIFEVTLYSSTSQSSIGDLPQYPDYQLIPSASYTVNEYLTAGVQTTVDLTNNQYYIYLLDHASDYIVASVKAHRSGESSNNIGNITCPIQGY